jgi:ABC-type nitrate/sulfonate/bicarbonate transport system substrate-binding protein
VGISEPGGGEVPIMRGMLREAGLTEGTDVELLPVGEGGALTVTNFENGTIAAYTSSFVDILGVQASGFELRDITPERIRAFPSNGLVMLSDRFATDKDLAGRFARAIAKATLFAQTNPDAAATIMAKYAPEQFTDPTVGRRLLDEILRRTALPQGTDQYGLHASQENWDGLVGFLSVGSVEEGALAGPVDVPAMLATDGLATANDFDRAKVIADANAYKAP